MYRMKNIVHFDMVVDVPTCMYKMKNIHGNCRHEGGTANDPVTTQPDITHQKNSVTMESVKGRQEKILKQLEELKVQMERIKSNLKSEPCVKSSNVNSVSNTVGSLNIKDLEDIVIHADPVNPPYSLIVLQNIFAKSVQLFVQVYTHSSINSLPEVAEKFVNNLNKFEVNGVPRITIRLIWKNVKIDQFEFMVSSTIILGEVNFLRYISEITSSFNYNRKSFDTDDLLDICAKIMSGKNKTKTKQLIQLLNKQLGKNDYLFGSSLTVADLAAYSAVRQTQLDLTVNMNNWIKRCEILV